MIKHIGYFIYFWTIIIIIIIIIIFCSAKFNIKARLSLLADAVLEFVDFCVGDVAVHASVHDAETFAGPAVFGMDKLIDAGHVFYHVPRNFSDQFKESIVTELHFVVGIVFLCRVFNVVVLFGFGFGAGPESDVFVAWREFTEGLEFDVAASRSELLQKARVLRPKQSNVGDVEENHRPSLQSNPKRPSVRERRSHSLWVIRRQKLLVNHSTAQDLVEDRKPQIIIKIQDTSHLRLRSINGNLMGCALMNSREELKITSSHSLRKKTSISKEG